MEALNGKSVSLIVLSIIFSLIVITGKAQTVDNKAEIKKVEKQITALKEAKSEVAGYATPDLLNQFDFQIDSLKEVVANLKAPAPKEEKVAEVKEVKVPSVAEYQTTTIGKTTERGTRTKENTIEVSNYAFQSEMSKSYQAMQFDQIMADPNGMTMAKPNGLITYAAVGKAAQQIRYGYGAPAVITIIPVDKNNQPRTGANAITIEIEVNQEKELYLPTGRYKMITKIAGVQIGQTLYKDVVVGQYPNIRNNKEYSWVFSSYINNFGNTLAYYR